MNTKRERDFLDERKACDPNHLRLFWFNQIIFANVTLWKNNVSKEGLKLIYSALIYPLLMYCNVLWGSCCQSYLNNLNTIQKKIIRIMSFKGKFEHAAPLFLDFNVLTFGNINKYMCLLYVHRCLHEEGNDVFSPYDIINDRRRLADSNSLIIPDVRSTHSRQSVRWLGSISGIRYLIALGK